MRCLVDLPCPACPPASVLTSFPPTPTRNATPLQQRRHALLPDAHGLPDQQPDPGVERAGVQGPVARGHRPVRAPTAGVDGVVCWCACRRAVCPLCPPSKSRRSPRHLLLAPCPSIPIPRQATQDQQLPRVHGPGLPGPLRGRVRTYDNLSIHPATMCSGHGLLDRQWLAGMHTDP